MKKIIFTTFILALYCTISYGQDTCRLSYRITTIPFQYLFNDYNLTFEKAVSNRRTLGLTLGYRPSKQKEQKIKPHGIFGNYSFGNYFNPIYNAITIGVNSKKYFSKYNNRYMEANIYYRFWWFDNKDVTYNDGDLDEWWSGIRTERQNVFGIKLLFGKSYQIKTNIKIKPVIDLYWGVGLRYKTCRFETFNGTFYYENFLPYKLETEKYWAPSLHLGLKVGFGWFERGKFQCIN